MPNFLTKFHGTVWKYSKQAYSFQYKYTLQEIQHAECLNYINIFVSATIVARSTTWHEI